MTRGRGTLEPGAVAGRQVERRGRSHRPPRRLFPPVRPARIGQHRRRVRIGRTFQIMVEERLHPLRAPLRRSVAVEGQRAELVAIMVGARVPPWADHQVQQLGAFVLVLERAVDRRSAVAVLLVPFADLEHRRDGQRARGHPLVDRLAAARTRCRPGSGTASGRRDNSRSPAGARNRPSSRPRDSACIRHRCRPRLRRRRPSPVLCETAKSRLPVRNAPLWNQSSPSSRRPSGSPGRPPSAPDAD